LWRRTSTRRARLHFHDHVLAAYRFPIFLMHLQQLYDRGQKLTMESPFATSLAAVSMGLLIFAWPRLPRPTRRRRPTFRYRSSRARSGARRFSSVRPEPRPSFLATHFDFPTESRRTRTTRYPMWFDNLYLSIFALDMAGNSPNLYISVEWWDHIRISTGRARSPW
jgi:hypothetical protein